MNTIIWFTGQPGSGKTTLAEHLIQDKLIGFLKMNSRDIVHIDGDYTRKVLANAEPTCYGRDGRVKNINFAINTSVFLFSKGYLPVVSLVSPYRWMRESLKVIGKGTHYSRQQPLFKVLEVYCHTTEIRGKEKYFVEDYQEPLTDFLDMDTTNRTIGECTDEVLTVYRQMATIS